jgi:hypothetical protein
MPTDDTSVAGPPSERESTAVEATSEPAAAPLPPGHGLTCFVIGPIGNKFAPAGTEERTTYEEAVEVLEEIILRACAASSVGLEPVRADGLSKAGELTEQVFRRLRNDDVVIADLTGANPNVMYELGLRHTRNKLTIQIGEYSRLPFDVNIIRTVMFSRSPNGLINARKELQELLEAGLAGGWDPVSATRVWNDLGEEGEGDGKPPTPPVPSEPLPPRPEGDEGAESTPAGETLEEDEAPGLVDVLADAEGAQDLLLSSTNAIAAQIELMGTLAEEQTAKMEQSEAAGLGMRGRLAHILGFANKLDQIANNLELHVAEYADAMARVSSGYSAIIDEIERSDSEQLKEPEIREFGETIRGSAAVARGSLAGLSDLVESMTETSRYAKALRRPTQRVAIALNAFAKSTEILNELDRRLQILGIDLPSDVVSEDAVTDEAAGDSANHH